MLPRNFKVIMLSRGRDHNIGRYSLPLFPYAKVTVDESEMDAYAKVVPKKQLLPHPAFPTMADLRNWLLAEHSAEFVWHVHDDLIQLTSLVGWRARRTKDPAVIAQLLETTAYCARDAGAYLFGFGNISGGTPHYNKMSPFRLNGFVRNVIGFREGHELQWDPLMMGHYDVDLGMQALQKHRIVWRDERFIFDDVPLASNSGGFAGIRTAEGVIQGRRQMLLKWGGKYVRFGQPAGRSGGIQRSEATVLRVLRKQAAVKETSA